MKYVSIKLLLGNKETRREKRFHPTNMYMRGFHARQGAEDNRVLILGAAFSVFRETDDHGPSAYDVVGAGVSLRVALLPTAARVRDRCSHSSPCLSVAALSP